MASERETALERIAALAKQHGIPADEIVEQLASERETELMHIVALADQHSIAATEIVAHMEAPETPERQSGFIKTLVSYTGGIFVFAGLVVLAATLWPDIGGVQRVIITLGPGMAAFVMGFVAVTDSRFAKSATPFFLVAAFLQPAGLFVFLDEFSPRTGPLFAAAIVFGVIALQQSLAYLQLKRASLLFVSIIYYLAFIASALRWIDVFEDFIAIIVGMTTLFLSRHAAKRGHRLVAAFWYSIGTGCLLGGIFTAVEGGPAEILYLGANGFLIYLSIGLVSRSMLTASVIGLFGYFSYFTSEYFADAIGWPVAMILMGMVMIGLSAYAVRLGQGIGDARSQGIGDAES